MLESCVKAFKDFYSTLIGVLVCKSGWRQLKVNSANGSVFKNNVGGDQYTVTLIQHNLAIVKPEQLVFPTVYA